MSDFSVLSVILIEDFCACVCEMCTCVWGERGERMRSRVRMGVEALAKVEKSRALSL